MPERLTALKPGENQRESRCLHKAFNMVTLMDEIEIITEWPVIPDTDVKETKHSTSQRQKNSEFTRFSLSDNLHIHQGKQKRDPNDSAINLEKRCRYGNKTECLANAALAKWWRRNYTDHREDMVNVVGCHPNTRIKMIARLPEAKEFIKNEIQRLTDKLDNGHSSSDLHASLGTFLERNGETERALHHYRQAVILQPEEKEYNWLIHKAERILKIKQEQLKHLHKVEKGSDFPTSTQVERKSAKCLTVKDFFLNYECTSTPLIITDQQVTTIPWDLEHIKEKAGECSVTLKKPVKQSAEWARLENSQTTTVSSYIGSIMNNTLQEPLYLFDWSLPLNCPALAEEIIIPKYFAENFLQRTRDGSLYKDSWPSLFVSPAGITSELHVDAFGSNFWMALFQGKKRWTFFPKTDVPYLYPEYEHSLDPVFDVDLAKPNTTKHPLLQLTTPIECVLEPGDILFVPAGCPHRVENLEPSLAISANFVDQSNFDQVKNELVINSLLDIRSDDLLHQFNDTNFNDKMDMNLKDKTFYEYKNYTEFIEK